MQNNKNQIIKPYSRQSTVRG